MAFRPNKKDLKLLASIAEHGFLTVKQLSALSQRSRQVVNRRKRVLEKEGLLVTAMPGCSPSRGRPEDLIFLTEKGIALLQDKKMLSSNAAPTTAKATNPLFRDHDLLVNWFRIHLVHIERTIPQLSVHYIDPGSASENNLKKSAEFIPDGVFSITHKENRKTLLFFLEVDMGTETKRNEVRQKILNYQASFRSGQYKQYQEVFGSELNGFRLLFLTNTAARLASLSRLVQEIPHSDFIWLTDQEEMFSHGSAAEIWARGGRNDQPPQSILGPKLACETPILDSEE